MKTNFNYTNESDSDPSAGLASHSYYRGLLEFRAPQKSNIKIRVNNIKLNVIVLVKLSQFSLL